QYAPPTAMTQLSSTDDLAAVFDQAREIAEESEQRLSTAHVLLALFTVPNRAEAVLKDRGVDEDRLLEVLGARSELHREPLDIMPMLDERIAQTAESTGADRANCLHLLVALARLQTSSANRMLRGVGIDLAALRNQVISYLTGAMPRRLAGIPQEAAAARAIASQVVTDVERAPSPAAAPAMATAPAPAPMRPTTVTVSSAPSGFALDPKELPWLASLGRNLTQLAAEGRIDPVVGREREVEEVLDILSKRRANNPCLIGEPGVGKTAVVEALALRLTN